MLRSILFLLFCSSVSYAQTCTSPFVRPQETFISVGSIPEIRQFAKQLAGLYLYIGDISDAWKRKPFAAVVFRPRLTWSSGGAMSDVDFRNKERSEGFPSSSWFLLRPGQVLNFSQLAQGFFLRVVSVHPMPQQKDYVTLTVCQQ